mmetsp:Transcript_4529/g.16233  ORF Transcript_4529/g.16233 Transcript_4529/m.16233 type:complete len:647 (+) Transcript_4529:83-2023(+)
MENFTAPMAALVFLFAGCVAVALRRTLKALITLTAMSPVPLGGRIAAKVLRTFSYNEEQFLGCDGAGQDVVDKRRAGIRWLANTFQKMYHNTLEESAKFVGSLSDLRFTDTNRVPFPFQKYVRENLSVASVVLSSEGPTLMDLDGNRTLDVSGSYGFNVCGYDMYKQFLARGLERVKDIGPVLGPVHPLVMDNIRILKEISGLDEISFNMSGTEAMMCAVRLACFNTKRSLVVCFSGAYHGWWDGVQPGPGNERVVRDCLVLKDMNKTSLQCIAARSSEIACVIVNPLQVFNPNSPPPNDMTMAASDIRKTPTAEEMEVTYKEWLQNLRRVCSKSDVPLIFDEVYSGFRIAPGGGQEQFGVKADMVVYGKTCAGGMPIGVVCGTSELMRRFDPEHPARVAYVLGTFSAHPLTMGAMSEFLAWARTEETRSLYDRQDARLTAFVKDTNAKMEVAGLPVRLSNYKTVFTVLYNKPGRFNWMLQYYMRAEGITLSWVGTGRLLVSLDFEEEHYAELQEKLMRAVTKMTEHGWFSGSMTNAQIKMRIGKESLHTIAKHLLQNGPLGEMLGVAGMNEEIDAKPPKTLDEFYSNIMKRKADDHAASHSNEVNQFLHLVSSSMFIYCYAIIFNDHVSAMVLGLISLFLRQVRS